MTLAKLDGKGIAIALLSTATWATAGIFIRWLPGWSPSAILAGRCLVAAIALLPVVLSRNIRRDLLISARSPFVWLLSLPMVGCYFLGTTAFQLATVGEVTLLISTSPLFVVAYKLIARIPIQKQEGIGTALAVAGVGLIALPEISVASSTSWRSLIGYLISLSAAALLAIYVLAFNALTSKGKRIRSIHVVFITCVLGSGLSLLQTAFLSGTISAIALNSTAILVFLGLGILSTAVSTLLYTIAAQRLPVVLAAAILLTEPIFAVFFASALLREYPSIWFGCGSILVLAGLLLVAKGTDSA